MLPIADALVPYLRDAIKHSPSKWVFPGVKGKMRTEESDPHIVLRRALVNAGLNDSYEHPCRRCIGRGAPHVEKHADDGLRLCPVCGMKLWAVASPRKMRFQDLRHTAITLLLRANVSWQHVQRIARHAEIKITIDTYGHLVVEDLREAVEKLPKNGRTD